MENINRGEIYYVFPAETNGSEQYGGRPAIVVSNNYANKYSPVIEVVYITTAIKKWIPTHVRIFSSRKMSTALCEAVYSIDKSRVGMYCGKCSKWMLRL